MKSKAILSFFPALLVVLLLAGARQAEAEDVHFSVGVGNGYHYHDYRTHDPAYSTWYPSTGSYYYDNSYYSGSTYYTTPYVYTTPSVEFNTWYGDGYRNHDHNYNYGRGGYSGGYRRGRGGNGR